MLQVQILSLVTRLASRGIKLDSARRALNRAGVSTRGLGLPRLFARAEAIHNNTQVLAGRRSTFKPGPGRGTVAEPFKVPANYRYVVNVTYRDPATGDRFTNARSVYSRERLSLGQAEMVAFQQAERGLRSPRGKSDPFAPFTVERADMLNAFHNEIL